MDDILEMPDSAPSSPAHCLFIRGERRFALPAGQVVEVVPLPRCTPVPLTPAVVRGIFSYADSVVPLLAVGATGPDQGRDQNSVAPVQARYGVIADAPWLGQTIRVALEADSVLADDAAGVLAENIDWAALLAAVKSS